MKRIYHLSTCATCRRLLEAFDTSGYELINLRNNPIDQETLGFLHQQVGSYEALFSKRSQLYKQLGLKDKNLSEADMKALILKEYTFIKRPIRIDGTQVWISKIQD
ncbi:MAG: hypothetical protein RLZZ301_464 [Bacteroidota bacterium]|jgi:arsenate reductase